MKIKIIPSDDIVSCGDGCCTSSGFHVINSKGEYEVFIMEMEIEDFIELIKHLIGEKVKIEVEKCSL